jgi:hypothetical protein
MASAATVSIEGSFAALRWMVDIAEFLAKLFGKFLPVWPGPKLFQFGKNSF